MIAKEIAAGAVNHSVTEMETRRQTAGGGTHLAASERVAIAIASDRFGQGDPELCRRLMTNFLHALEAARRIPGTICLYTDGVRLALDDSPVLAHLKTLEALGTRILICRTCLEYYGVSERVAVGQIDTMPGIVTALFEADSVLNL